MMDFLNSLKELNMLSTLIRLTVAVICGGIIGLDRGRHRRAAGLRTHMLVCLGAALTMIVGEYISLWLGSVAGVALKTDISRLSAQVINGIGFIGAGTIIVTNRQEIKGLTTAAGLWASACMGIAIGAGFFVGALAACVMIILSITLMRRVEGFIMSKARNMNLYVELEDINDIGLLIEKIKSSGIRIYDIEINKEKSYDGAYANAIFSMRLPEKQPHSDIITKLAGIRTIRSLEEI